MAVTATSGRTAVVSLAATVPTTAAAMTEVGGASREDEASRDVDVVEETNDTVDVGGSIDEETKETEPPRVAAIRAVVGAVLNRELGDADEDRARRYVATVRPGCTSKRYGYNPVKMVRRWAEEGGSTVGEVLPEEGDPRPSLSVEDGEMPTLGEELDDDTLAALGNMDTVRAAVKATQRQAKRRRKEVSSRRRLNGSVEDDVGDVVASLDAEIRTRRRHQAEKARAELEVRRQNKYRSSIVNGYRCTGARVSLLQRSITPSGVGEVADGRMVTVAADDGLPTATVLTEDGYQAIKLDSCARYSVAGTDWMLRGERSREKAPVDYVEGIGGILLDVLGVWRFELVNVYGQKISVKACIVQGCTSEFLVGVDFMSQHRAILDFNANEVRYREQQQLVVIPFRTDAGDADRKVAPVRLAKRTMFAQRTVTPIEIAVTAPDGETGIFVPTNSSGLVMLATTVATARHDKVLVPAVHVAGGKLTLPCKKALGTWIPLDQDMEVLELNGALDPKKLEQWLSELGDCVTPLDNEEEVQIETEDSNARVLMLKLLRAYREVTVSTGDCPPATTLPVEHHIDTGDAAPMMLKRRRHAQAEDAIIEENVRKMLSFGVIEEGNGAWGFPVVLVRKKDGEVRFCVDYRALNGITKKDVYPLPRIDETLDALGGARLFTTLDLRAGYWQIRVAERDKDKTAFTTKLGLYRFLRMPFGMMNAPSTFQRMMNGVLRGLNWLSCLVYLDDIVIFTRGGIERHVVDVATVLERLSTAGLTLKLKKCHFAATSMEYLGHELSSEGVRPVSRLITAVANFKRPENEKEVRSFIHLAGYYRKFIANFGTIAAPLTKLLRKDEVWRWMDEQERAFTRLKQELTSKPLLVYPDFKRPFRLVTDASKVGLGACLMQDQGHGLQPIAYASKVNSRAEANYTITELECLAVIWSIKLFRPYLYGRTFTIVTDHAALKWLMTSTQLTGRLHRWALTLQEYEFTIEYRPGSTNVVADALSRAPAAVLMAIGGTRSRASSLDSERNDVEDVLRDGGAEQPRTGDKMSNEEVVVMYGGSEVGDMVQVDVLSVTDGEDVTASGVQDAISDGEAVVMGTGGQDAVAGIAAVSDNQRLLAAVAQDEQDNKELKAPPAVDEPVVKTTEPQKLSLEELVRDGGDSGTALVLPVTRAQARKQSVAASTTDAGVLRGLPTLTTSSEVRPNMTLAMTSDAPTSTTSVTSDKMQLNTATATSLSVTQSPAQQQPRQVTWATPLEAVRVIPAVERDGDVPNPTAERVSNKVSTERAILEAGDTPTASTTDSRKQIGGGTTKKTGRRRAVSDAGREVVPKKAKVSTQEATITGSKRRRTTEQSTISKKTRRMLDGTSTSTMASTQLGRRSTSDP